MATQTVEFRSPPSQTVTAKLFTVGSDTEQASVAATEATNRKGTYSAAFTDEAAGEYELIAFVGAVSVARWFVTLTLTTATFQAYDKVGAVELDPAARVKLDASQPDYDLPTNTELNTALAASDDATLAAIAAEAVKTAAIKAKTDNLPSDPADQSLIITATDAVMTRLGSPAGASIAADIAAIDGGGGGGDATLAKQEEILTAVESVVDTVAAYAARMALEVQLRGFPNVICRNADYLIATESEIRITVEDLTGTAITEIAGTPVASLSWLFGMGTETAPNLIAGTCTWDADTDELVIEIAKASTAGKQTGSLTWQIGVSISESERWLGGGTTRLIERQF